MKFPLPGRVTWTVFDLAKGPPVMRCERCGGEWPLILPLLVKQVAGLADDFNASHRDCLEQEKGGGS